MTSKKSRLIPCLPNSPHSDKMDDSARAHGQICTQQAEERHDSHTGTSIKGDSFFLQCISFLHSTGHSSEITTSRYKNNTSLRVSSASLLSSTSQPLSHKDLSKNHSKVQRYQPVSIFTPRHTHTHALKTSLTMSNPNNLESNQWHFGTSAGFNNNSRPFDYWFCDYCNPMQHNYLDAEQCQGCSRKRSKRDRDGYKTHPNRGGEATRSRCEIL